MEGVAQLLRRWTGGAAPAVLTDEAVQGAARTHVGRVRTENEDRLLARPDRGLWVVADGMGGHRAGAAAAVAVVDALSELADDPAPIGEVTLRAALARANAHIFDGVGGSSAMSGATVVVALVDGRTATILWAGDSRAYRLRDGRAEPLTRDHSVVQELIDADLLTPEAARRHPKANVVTRALGVAATVQIDRVTAVLEPGDRLILCSDGISRSLDARDFTTMPAGLDAMADRLLANALQRDGSDNATVIVVG